MISYWKIQLKALFGGKNKDMAINLKMPINKELLSIPGVKLATLSAGLKDKDHKDLMLMVFDDRSIVSGTFTQNKFCAAPVLVSKNHLKLTSAIKALIVNTGSANAGTGDKGIKDAESVCKSIAKILDVKPSQVLPFSTGVIMTPLPASKINKAIPDLVKGLEANNWLAAAEAIMTTDTIPKAVSKNILIQDQKVTITGISKGSGMIHPNMATMLAFISTDANISLAMLQKLNKEIVNTTFNCISVDGDTSTNDSFIIAATNQAKHSKIAKEDKDYKVLKSDNFVTLDDVQFQKMKFSGLLDFFNKIITPEKAGAKKPDAKIFNYALKLTNKAPENCLMIGDDFCADILGALNVGIKAIHYNSKNEAFHNDCPIVSSHKDLNKLLIFARIVEHKSFTKAAQLHH